MWKFRHFDWPLFVAAIILFLAGLVMVYSTGLSGASENRLWLRQAAAGAVGLLGLFFLSNLDYRFFKKAGTVFFAFSVILLAAVLVFGLEIRGSRRWFELGIFNFQPAELSKLALIIVLARYFQLKRPFLHKFSFVLGSSVFALVPAGLIILQPDLGSALVHLAIWFGLLWISPMPRRHILFLLAAFLICAAVLWQFVLHDYQKDRLRNFLDPAADPQGSGYNSIQALVAVGSGGGFGQGLARGLQSQLRFLPERQTDFIFASAVEELGLMGGGLIILVFWFLLYRLYRIIRLAVDPFGRYLAAGILFLFFTQVAVNIGMNTGLVPVTGIPLPFLSYGGSSLMISMWAVGLAESVARFSFPLRFA